MHCSTLLNEQLGLLHAVIIEHNNFNIVCNSIITSSYACATLYITVIIEIKLLRSAVLFTMCRINKE